MPHSAKTQRLKVTSMQCILLLFFDMCIQHAFIRRRRVFVMEGR